jgi:hypothetical protein
MKKLIMFAACLSVTAMAFGQGAVNFGNRVTASGVDAIVKDAATGAALDAGTWQAQLYAGAAMDALSPVGAAVGFRTGAAAGYITAVERIVPGIAGGSAAWVAMAVWDSADGASYEVASAAFGKVGMSIPVQITLSSPPATPAPMSGMQAFSVAIVPEPSTLALGLLGIGALMMRRRR